MQRKSYLLLIFALLWTLLILSKTQTTVLSQALANPVSASGNYQLLNSIFAAGTTSSTLRSQSYQLVGTLGEPALPNNIATLNSANFQHQPGFLASVIATKRGDINLDGTVNSEDLNLLVTMIHHSPQPDITIYPLDYWQRGNLKQDNVWNVVDLQWLIVKTGQQ